MTAGRKDETLRRFAGFLARTMGLHFTRERLPELRQKLTPLAADEGFTRLDDYLSRLMVEPLRPEQLDSLARTLTIGETYFLRDPKSYQLLEERLLPPLIAARRQTDRTLRIWSAGCSTGEEPYSLAMLLIRAIPDLASWNVTIVGSDINPQALEKASRGVYSQWSFRNAPGWLLEYFQKREDGSFEILPRVRDMVRFARLNLADEQAMATSVWASGMDVIFCRNVMLYFDGARIGRTMASFHARLNETGWLFVGPTEIDHNNFQGFACRHYDGAFVLSKDPAGLPETRPFWCEQLLFEGGGAPPESRPADPPAKPAIPPTERASGSSQPPRQAPEPATAEKPAVGGYARALASYEAGDYPGAIEQVKGCHEAGEERARVWALGARACANIGDFANARHWCEKAIACDRLNAHNHYLLSIILEQQGDLTAAATALKHALYIDHDYLLAYFALGNLNRRRGDLKEAERNFVNALRLLERRHPHEVLAEAEGMAAGRLAEMIRGMVKRDGEPAESFCPNR